MTRERLNQLSRDERYKFWIRFFVAMILIGATAWLFWWR
jgi:hypothetical protein